jgi:hypothetical protein
MVVGAVAIVLGSKNAFVASTTGTVVIPGFENGTALRATPPGDSGKIGPLPAGSAAGVSGAANISGSSFEDDDSGTLAFIYVGEPPPIDFSEATTTTATSTGP